MRSHSVTIGQSWGGRVCNCWGAIFELSGHWEPWAGCIRRHGEANGEPSGDREAMENAQGFLHCGFRMPGARDERCHILRGIAAGGMYRRITRGFALSRLLKLLSQNVCGYPGGIILFSGCFAHFPWVFLVIRVVGGGGYGVDQFGKKHGPCGADFKTIQFLQSGMSRDHRKLPCGVALAVPRKAVVIITCPCSVAKAVFPPATMCGDYPWHLP